MAVVDTLFLIPFLTQEGINAYNLPFKNYYVVSLYMPKGKAPKKATIVDFINSDVKPVVQEKNIKYILVAEGSYFKALTGVSKIEPYQGYVLPCTMFDCWVLYIPSPKAIMFNPEPNKGKVDQALNALASHKAGNYQEPGKSLIAQAEYPQSVSEIKAFLDRIATYPKLTVDIETFSLKHPTAGIGSITFCWNEHNGGAFLVDHRDKTVNSEVRGLLRDFFTSYKGTCIYHNITFDVYILIYALFMKDLLDTEGLLNGLDIMLKNWDDTKLITYLATNSCARCELGLKSLAQSFAGNWAQENINDITQIPEKDLLQYNLVDGLSTWYVYNKYYPMMIQENQQEIYETLFKDATKDIIQMQLTGLPVNMDQVAIFKKEVSEDMEKSLKVISDSQITKDFTQHLNEQWVIEKNKTLKRKRVTLADAKETFNLGSTKQLRELLYDILKQPVLDKTDTGLPATSGDVLKKLLDMNQGTPLETFLEALIAYQEASKIWSTFIPLLENAFPAPDGWHYIYGSFNLGGTVSGRLSSSNPNLQNLPSTGTKYAKSFKKCIQAPKGWLFASIDFASLEDRISALTTKDPEKMRVYLEHYDG